MSFDIDPRVAPLAISPTLAAKERAIELAQAGRRVFRLGLGQSPFPVPSPVVAALRAAADERDYLPPGGLRILRESIADFHHRRHGLTFAADDVVVGPGSKELMFLLQLCFAGDILIPTPSWVTYRPQAILAGRTLVGLPGGGREDLMLSPDTLASVCARNPNRPRLLFINSPSNPTGLVYTEAELEALARVCRANGVIVLADDIYGDLGFAEPHISLASFYPEGTIVSSGLSKWCGAGGWRLGTFAFPDKLRPLRRALEAVASETYSSTSAPIQHAALVAFRPNVEIAAYVADARRILHGALHWAVATLAAARIDVPVPQGGFYLFPSFARLREPLARLGVTTDVALAERLLEDLGIVSLPGSAFGCAPHQLYLRLALVDFDGANAIANSSDVIDEAFVMRHMRPIYDAITSLADLARTWER